jgi:hypothetical protein
MAVDLPSLLFNGVFGLAKWLGRVYGNFYACSAKAKNVGLYTSTSPCQHDFHMNNIAF